VCEGKDVDPLWIKGVVEDRVRKALKHLLSDSFRTDGPRALGMFKKKIGAAPKLGDEPLGHVPSSCWR
jgi:hypothetical protein